MKGKRKHIPSPCDSEGKRTWDVYRLDQVIVAELPTRKRARDECKRLDSLERSATLSLRFRRYDPKGWMGDPSRGAALGRGSIRKGKPIGTITVCPVPLCRGGYDLLGTYWGSGAALYWYADEDGMVDSVIRSSDSATALETIRAEFPSAPLEVGKPIGPCPECQGSGYLCEADEDCQGEECEECATCYLCEGSEG